MHRLYQELMYRFSAFDKLKAAEIIRVSVFTQVINSRKLLKPHLWVVVIKAVLLTDLLSSDTMEIIVMV